MNKVFERYIGMFNWYVKRCLRYLPCSAINSFFVFIFLDEDGENLRYRRFVKIQTIKILSWFKVSFYLQLPVALPDHLHI